jgi:flagellar hook protein FlgE
MFETIFIGTSGLMAHAKGLRVVGNNLANVNTPGFKSAQLQFGELFDHGGALSGQTGQGGAQLGTGVDALTARLNFKAGADQATGSPLDLQINGNGFYVLQREGETLYSRAGDLRFDDKGVLVNTNGDHVQALDAGGQLADVTLDQFEHSLAKPTAEVKVRGNLPTPAIVAGAPLPAPTTINAENIIDADGVAHTLKLTFQQTATGVFTVTVNDGSTAVGSGSLKFALGSAVAGSNVVNVNYTPAGGTATAIKFDFSSASALAGTGSLQASADGYLGGVRADQSIKADGTLVVHYSNGQTVDGPRLALANFDTVQDLEQAGGSAFRKSATAVADYGNPASGSFGALVAGHREGSNVDLAEEFSNLILMQRGYQASSHVISTANDMIQQLFDMKGR